MDEKHKLDDTWFIGWESNRQRSWSLVDENTHSEESNRQGLGLLGDENHLVSDNLSGRRVESSTDLLNQMSRLNLSDWDDRQQYVM